MKNLNNFINEGADFKYKYHRATNTTDLLNLTTEEYKLLRQLVKDASQNNDVAKNLLDKWNK